MALSEMALFTKCCSRAYSYKFEWKEKVWWEKVHQQQGYPQPSEGCQAKSIQGFEGTSQEVD